MPGRTRREALEFYGESIRETLGCITRSLVGFGGGVSSVGGVGTLNFIPEPIVSLYKSDLALFFSQGYTCSQNSTDQLWRVRTTSYIYTVHDCRDDGNPREVFSYQWHPHSAYVSPHFHFKKGETMVTRAHLPTGRIAIEAIVECLLQDFGVDSPQPDWKTILSRNRELPERSGEWM